MSKFVPLEKRSKREQKAFHASQRRDWGALNPVTRKAGSPKAYNRAKSRQWRKEPHAGGIFVYLLKTKSA